MAPTILPQGQERKPNPHPISEKLAAIDRQLQSFTETLCGLSNYWPSCRPVALWWDEYRKVLATDEALGTYRAIYGGDMVRGLRYIWKFVERRYRGEPPIRIREPLQIHAPLPPDAVVISQGSRHPHALRHVLTIVSEHEKCVVKIFAKERKSRFENELNAWRLAEAAGIGHRVPELIGSGESENGFCWLVSRLVRNDGIFYPPIVEDRLWQRHLLKQILPDLQRFYEQSGLEVLTGCAWLDRLRAQAAEHPMSSALQQMTDLAEDARRRAGEDRLPLAVVHGDLRPHNVHTHGGNWWLIDWSMSRRAPVTVDLWPKPMSALANAVYCRWLRGDTNINELTRSLRAPLEMYREWLASWMGIKPDADSLRFQVLATLLHRLSRNHWSIQSPLSVATFKALGIRN